MVRRSSARHRRPVIWDSGTVKRMWLWMEPVNSNTGKRIKMSRGIFAKTWKTIILLAFVVLVVHCYLTRGRKYTLKIFIGGIILGVIGSIGVCSVQ